MRVSNFSAASPRASFVNASISSGSNAKPVRFSNYLASSQRTSPPRFQSIMARKSDIASSRPAATARITIELAPGLVDIAPQLASLIRSQPGAEIAMLPLPTVIQHTRPLLSAAFSLRMLLPAAVPVGTR